MTPTPDEAALIARFAETYRAGRSDVVQRIERRTFGCAYGATSWTTRDEAETVAGMLALEPGKRLLEVGTGAGWPGLYLAHITGCDAALIDLPFEGLRIAAARAASDGLADRCWPVMADGATIPFAREQFDAIVHSDVLCCLDAKLAVLTACRRVIRDAGKMVFSVLSIAPNLTRSDHERAVTLGPAFIDSAVDYPSMLQQAGWETTDHTDITAAFFETVRNLLQQEESHADALTDLLGEGKYSERLANRRDRLAGVESGLIRRELFSATPAPHDEDGRFTH